MISLQALQSSYFPGAHVIRHNLIKVVVDIPAFRDTYYLTESCDHRADWLMVVRSDEDDDFAVSVLQTVLDRNLEPSNVPRKVPLTFPNPYEFEMAFVVGPNYHGYLEGALDDQRSNLYLCVPSYDCEFSGTETVEEFSYMWIHTFTHRLKRPICPKIKARWMNPVIQSHTNDRFVPCTSATVAREVKNLEGVSEGWLEIMNFQDQQIHLAFSNDNQYLIRLPNAELLRVRDTAIAIIQEFVVLGFPYNTTNSP